MRREKTNAFILLCEETLNHVAVDMRWRGIYCSLCLGHVVEVGGPDELVEIYRAETSSCFLCIVSFCKHTKHRPKGKNNGKRLSCCTALLGEALLTPRISI